MLFAMLSVYQKRALKNKIKNVITKNLGLKKYKSGNQF